MVKDLIAVSDDLTCSLRNKLVSYTFKVVPETKELLHIHFGGPIDVSPPAETTRSNQGWSSSLARIPREFPDLGRGDYREPAFQIKHDGTAVTHFKYVDYEIKSGRPGLDGLPSTFAKDGEAETLIVHLRDDIAKIDAYLTYTIFNDYAVITRSQRFVNNSSSTISIEKAGSFSVDLRNQQWDMLQLSGEWSREAQTIRRKVYPGTQGFQSLTGYSSHLHTTDHLSYPLEAGASFTTPECVAVYSPTGLGGMSRTYHRLYRQHLSASRWTLKQRPALLNNWEGTYLDFDADKLYGIAQKGSELGVKLFVMDDGWFGDKNAREVLDAGLGDWFPNPRRFPNGLADLVDKVNRLKPKDSTEKMQFGIWVEPEMVNAKSDLYAKHPDWALASGDYNRTTQRNQLVLNVSLPEVQEYIIDSITTLLQSANIVYVKWDNNRGMHETPSPATPHAYMLGLYKVLDTLTNRFPDVLFEGCASGGGRIDPDILRYWPQSWTSDNNDGLDRLAIQFGTSMIYPASSMAGHIAAQPSHQTDRTTPIEFRAHVAMMCGSFGFELDPNNLSVEDQEKVPALIKLSEKINPIVVNGDQYRIARPEESNWPAVQYLSEDKSTAVLLAYQMQHAQHIVAPVIKLQGLEGDAMYRVSYGEEIPDAVVDGNGLMNHGILLGWRGDYQSRIVWITKE